MVEGYFCVCDPATVGSRQAEAVILFPVGFVPLQASGLWPGVTCKQSPCSISELASSLSILCFFLSFFLSFPLPPPPLVHCTQQFGAITPLKPCPSSQRVGEPLIRTLLEWGLSWNGDSSPSCSPLSLGFLPEIPPLDELVKKAEVQV